MECFQAKDNIQADFSYTVVVQSKYFGLLSLETGLKH